MSWKVLATLALLSAGGNLARYVASVQAHNRLERAIDGETMAEIVGRLQGQGTPLARRLPQYGGTVSAVRR